MKFINTISFFNFLKTNLIKAWQVSFNSKLEFSSINLKMFLENCWKDSTPVQTIILSKLFSTIITTESFKLQQIRSWKCLTAFSSFQPPWIYLVSYFAWQLHRLIILYISLKSVLQFILTTHKSVLLKKNGCGLINHTFYNFLYVNENSYQCLPRIQLVIVLNLLHVQIYM